MASRTGVGREAELRVCSARIDEWRQKRIAACGQPSEQTEIAPALTGSAATPSGKSLKHALPHNADRRQPSLALCGAHVSDHHSCRSRSSRDRRNDRRRTHRWNASRGKTSDL